MPTKQKKEQSKMLPAKKEKFDLMLRNEIEIKAKPKNFSNSELIFDKISNFLRFISLTGEYTKQVREGNVCFQPSE